MAVKGCWLTFEIFRDSSSSHAYLPCESNISLCWQAGPASTLWGPIYDKERNYRKRGSASYIGREVLSVRERERHRQTGRERRKWRHHCRAKICEEFTLSLAKIRTIGDELTLSLAKKSHFSFLPSHFPSLPSRRGHHGGAMSSRYFPLPKIFSPSGFVPPLSNGTSRATSDRKPKTNDQILPSPIFLPIEKLNQINTKNYWK